MVATIFSAEFACIVAARKLDRMNFMSLAPDAPRANFGLVAFFFGAGALLAATLLTSGVFMPEPEQSVGASIGEIARDIKDAAAGVFSDAASTSVATPDPAPFDPTALLSIIAPVLAAVAVVLGGISLFRHEPTSLPKYAIGLGLGAVLMQYVFWMALLICGTMILISILKNLDSIFEI